MILSSLVVRPSVLLEDLVERVAIGNESIVVHVYPGIFEVVTDAFISVVGSSDGRCLSARKARLVKRGSYCIEALLEHDQFHCPSPSELCRFSFIYLPSKSNNSYQRYCTKASKYTFNQLNVSQHGGIG